MKKILAVFLIITMSISMIACGGSSKKGESKVPVIGNWECEKEDSTLQFNEDHTGKVINRGETMEVTWKYDEASHLLLVTLVEEDWTEEATYMSDSDEIYVDGWLYNRVEE